MIGERIKIARKARGLTQQELAALLGKNISWVKNAETRMVQFRPDDLALLSKALRVEPGVLLGKSGKVA